MKELYFVSPYSRSMRTIHFQYDYAGKNDLINGIITNDTWWEK